MCGECLNSLTPEIFLKVTLDYGQNSAKTKTQVPNNIYVKCYSSHILQRWLAHCNVRKSSKSLSLKNKDLLSFRAQTFNGTCTADFLVQTHMSYHKTKQELQFFYFLICLFHFCSYRLDCYGNLPLFIPRNFRSYETRVRETLDHCHHVQRVLSYCYNSGHRMVANRCL